MQSSLNATDDGLDQLNQARGTVSQSKDQLYAEADVALGDLASLADTLEAGAEAAERERFGGEEISRGLGFRERGEPRRKPRQAFCGAKP